MTAVDAYARDVDAGRIPAGKYHRLSCARHLRDRGREHSAAFPYVFDAARADRFFAFAEGLRHYKGQWDGERIVLQPHQRFRLGSIFGWVHRDTGMRRFRTAYNEIPRKNGKSLEAGVVAVYVTFCDGEPGAEGYCAATKREQARIVFGDAQQLVRRSRGRHGLNSLIKVRTYTMHRLASASRLVPLGADYDSADGLNPHLIIVDEFHAQKNRGLLDVLETATGARRQPLNFQITTAGQDPFSPGGEQHEYAVRILERALVDETFFAFIAHAEPNDDWTDEATWQKANPNYGISVLPDDLRALATKATAQPSAAAAFKQKRLNIWVHSATPWLSMDGWHAGQTTWDPASLEGQPCWGGLDLASKLDLAAFVLAFPPTPERPTWRYLGHALTPADTVTERALRDRAPYQSWIDAGYLRTNPGKRIDHHAMADLVCELGERYDVQEIGYDPWNIGNLHTDLTAEHFQMTEVPQNTQRMSEPSKEFEADTVEGRTDTGGNPLMLWTAANVVVLRDSKDNIFPTKKKSRGRIDPIVAAIIARKMAAGPDDEEQAPAIADHDVIFV